MTGGWLLMCCGCKRFLDTEGKPVEQRGGIVAADSIASFATHEAADEAALKAGWQVKDEQGANHRCPDCVREEKTLGSYYQPRGAYVRVEDLPTSAG